MQYPTLRALLAQSASSRTFFVSLPVALQTKPHEYDAYIHSAAQLRQTAQQVYRCESLAALGGWRTTERNDRHPQP